LREYAIYTTLRTEKPVAGHEEQEENCVIRKKVLTWTNLFQAIYILDD